MKAADVVSNMLPTFASDIYILLIIRLISCVVSNVTHTFYLYFICFMNEITQPLPPIVTIELDLKCSWILHCS